MAKLPGAFNQADHDDMQDFSLLPDGEYNFVITESEMKETNSGNGEYLNLTHEVIDGEFKGRKFWNKLNLINNNPAAVKIAQEALATLCRAAGVSGMLEDSEELHNIPMTAKLGIQKGKDGNPDNQKIKKYMPLEGAAKPASTKSTKEERPKAKRRPIFEDEE